MAQAVPNPSNDDTQIRTSLTHVISTSCVRRPDDFLALHCLDAESMRQYRPPWKRTILPAQAMGEKNASRPGQDGAGGVTLLTPVQERLSLELYQILQHLVRGRNYAGVRLEATLGGDHGRELLGQVYVRHFQRA